MMSRIEEGAGTVVPVELFKEAMSRWSSGVGVVAVHESGQAKGMTVSSFTSVSANPPLILLSVSGTARILPSLLRQERFVINLLREEQEDVSRHFAGRPVLQRDPFPAIGDPVLPGSLVSFVCSLWAEYPGGDHRIIVGEVEDIQLGESGQPLVYTQRGYRKLF